MSESNPDIGKYNKDAHEYERHLRELTSHYPEGVHLSPEYAHWIQDNQIRLLIRLARYKFVSKLLKPTDSVLEVGCGSGLGSIFLAQHSKSVLGIDVKTSDIEEALALNQRNNVDFKVLDLFEDQSNDKYDTVVSLDVIEHLTVEQGQALVAEMSRRLNPGGLLVIGSPSIWSYPYQSPISQVSHVHCYDLPELETLVEGFVDRTISFSMNDELVHTGYHKMAWYYFVIGFKG